MQLVFWVQDFVSLLTFLMVFTEMNKRKWNGNAICIHTHIHTWASRSNHIVCNFKCMRVLRAYYTHAHTMDTHIIYILRSCCCMLKIVRRYESASAQKFLAKAQVWAHLNLSSLFKCLNRCMGSCSYIDVECKREIEKNSWSKREEGNDDGHIHPGTGCTGRHI